MNIPIQGPSSAYNQPAAQANLPESRAEQAARGVEQVARGVEPKQPAIVQTDRRSLLNQPAPPTRLHKSTARRVVAVKPKQAATVQADRRSLLNQPAIQTNLSTSRVDLACAAVAVTPMQSAITQAYQNSQLSDLPGSRVAVNPMQSALAQAYQGSQLSGLPESRAEQAAGGMLAGRTLHSAVEELRELHVRHQAYLRERTITLPPYESIYSFFTELDEGAILSMQSRIQESTRHDKLELRDLVKHGLVPNKKITISNTNYFCSAPFKSNNHVLVIVLVEIENKIYPRFFYQSNSQGLWRVAPYGYIDENSNLRKFGKGSVEYSLHAPTKLSIALNSLLAIPPKEGFSFIPFIEKKEELVRTEIFGKVKITGGIKPSNYTSETAAKDIKLPVYDPGFHPDFTRPTEKIKQTLGAYGEVTIETYPSIDGIYTYTIIVANDGKAFLAGVENTNAPINEFGIRSISPCINEMSNPLLEYDIQIQRGYHPYTRFNPYGDNCDYLSNWNYVRELEVIERYYESQGKEVPPKV